MRIAVGDLGGRFEFHGLEKIANPVVDLLPSGGFFMDDEKEAETGAGLMPYNVVRDLVNRYVAAVKIFDEQIQAAVKMNISRQTFGRIIEAAHKKIADVLLNGKALKIEGGEVAIEETKPCCQVKGRRAKRDT